PGFADLPDDARSFVLDRLAEAEKYLDAYNRLLPLRPADALSEAELKMLRDELLRRQPPDDWKGTEAAEMWAAKLNEAEALLMAADQARQWYAKATGEARDLLAFEDYRGRRINWREWYAQARDLLAPGPQSGRRPPPRKTDPVRDAQGKPLGVTLGVV